MCGICGYVDVERMEEADHQVVGHSMGLAIKHRGPDSSGLFVDSESGVVLVHRRLAIIDLSDAGAQPMRSASGRYRITFNGEIYNHLELRHMLEDDGKAPQWVGHSDTETLLAAIEAWGLEQTLCKSVGMFAFALWDNKDRRLSLARDRMGEKPLYYGFQNGAFLFASELKALRKHPSFDASISRDSLLLYMQLSFIPAPHSIFENIYKLNAGCYAHLHVTPGSALPHSVEINSYWSINDAVETGLAAPLDIGLNASCDQLKSALKRSVKNQMQSDVPLGAFLSGGIDSSLVVAMMQEQSDHPIKTFSIGFEDKLYDESRYAKKVAAHLGTDHTELIVRPADVISVIPLLSQIYCEPFADSSQLPTYLVSRLAKESVTVVLTGDGADEIFGGYNRYLTADTIWAKVSSIPKFVRRLLAKGLMLISPGAWDRGFALAMSILPRRFDLRTPGDKAHKLAGILEMNSEFEYFNRLTSLCATPDEVVLGGKAVPFRTTDPDTWPNTDNFKHWMMAMDSMVYLPDDICVKVDRAAMSNSLETRAPFLDHRIVEMAWKLPLELKIRMNKSKWLIRRILYEYIPRELVERPKMGFAIPIGSWMRGPLRPWVETLLSEEKLIRQGYFDVGFVSDIWKEHLSERKNWEHVLWNILMFQEWLEEYESI